jgi:RNA-directed DNA polymerase
LSRDRRRAEQKESETSMSLEDALRQKSRQLELPLGYRGEALKDRRSVEALTATNEDDRSSDAHLMERVVEEGNVRAAQKRIRQNKGSAGIDGMSVEELPGYLAENWGGIRGSLLTGT